MSDSLKTEYDKLFIGGKWTEPSTDEVIEVHCPATGEYVGKVPMAAAADVDAAVAAARAAFDNGPWPSTPPKERAAVIAAAVKLMEERKDLFTKLLAAETGQPQTIIEAMHWMGSMGAMNFFATGAVDQVKWTEIAQRLLRADHRPSRAGRRGGRDRGMERAAVLGGQQTGPGAAGRLHGGAQAGR